MKTRPIFMLLLEIFLVQIVSDIAKGYTAHDELRQFLSGTLHRQNEESWR